MPRVPGRIALCSVLLLMVPGACVYADSFWNDRSEGWWFYEPDPVPIVKPEPKPTPKIDTSLVVTLPKTPPESTAEDPGPVPFSATWLKVNLPRYQQIALDNPGDVDAVASYALLKRMAMDNAQLFTRTYKRALLRYPVLDESTNRPMATFATRQVDEAAIQARDQLLKKIAERSAGLFLFVKPDCPVCGAQTAALSYLKSNYGFEVKPILVGGDDPKGRPIYAALGNVALDSGQAASLHPVALPAIYLVNPKAAPSKQILSIGQGGTSVPQLMDSLIEQSLVQGVITDGEYDETLNFNFNPLGNMARTAVTPDPSSEGAEKDKSNFIPPEHLANFLQRSGAQP